MHISKIVIVSVAVLVGLVALIAVRGLDGGNAVYSEDATSVAMQWAGRDIVVTGGSNRSVGLSEEAARLNVDGYTILVRETEIEANGTVTPLASYERLVVALTDTGLSVSADGKEIIEPDPALLRATLERRAKGGEVRAQRELAEARLAEGAEASDVMELLESAAKGGDVTAMRMLGGFWENGVTGAVNLAEAKTYYELASKAGDLEATTRLGSILAANGKLLAKSVLEEAADRGSPEAMYLLAQLLEPRAKHNIVVSGKRLSLIKKAAKGGFAEAQHAEALLYEAGLRQALESLNSYNAHRVHSAAYWHKKAAEQGHAGSQLRLGLIFAEGLFGETADAAKACTWLLRAKASGETDADALIAKLSGSGAEGCDT